jgi:serine/threonine protein kinase
MRYKVRVPEPEDQGVVWAGGSAPALRPVAEGRYVDFLPVGEGGMGIVYWALDTELHRQVAFKVIRPPDGPRGAGVTPPAPFRLHPPGAGDKEESASFEEMTARFLQEAWVTGGMEHPGIVPVYELGRTEAGVPYYTMRFVRGNRTLEDAIKERHGLGFDERLQLLDPFLKVCDAIRYAHSRGVIHRDLKPRNVALGRFGEAIVLDWGLAKVRGHGDLTASRWHGRVEAFRRAAKLDSQDSVVGTPGYMPPEAARGEVEALDERSDVYGLAAILYEILSGRLPFEFDTFPEYALKVNTRPVEDPRTHDPRIPAALALLCLRGLSRDPGDRPGSADELAEGIRAWQVASAREREGDAHLAAAEEALAGARASEGEARLRDLDRAADRARRVLDHRPEDPRGLAIVAETQALRERGVVERERSLRGRLLRRFVGVTLVLAALLGVLVAVMLESRRRDAEVARTEAEHARADAVAARGRAEADRAAAEELSSFLAGELQDELESVGRSDLLLRLGERAEAYYASLPAEAVTPETLRTWSAALRRLGDVYHATGRLARAEGTYASALEVARTLEALDAGSASGRFERLLAETSLARVQQERGYATPAVAAYEANLEALGALHEAAPEWREVEAALSDLHADLGTARVDAGEWPEALAHFEEALRIARGLEAREPTRLAWTRRALKTEIAIGQLLALSGQPDVAVGRLAATLARAGALDPAFAGEVGAELVALARLRLAAVLVLREPVQALEHAGAAAEAFRALAAKDEGNASHRMRVALALQQIGDARLHGQQDALAAFPAYREAYETARRIAREDPTHARWTNLVVNLSDRMVRAGGSVGASAEDKMRWRREAEALARGLLARDPANAKWRHLAAYAIAARGFEQVAVAEGVSALAEALDLLVPLLPENPRDAEVAELLVLVAGRVADASDDATARDAFARARAAFAEAERSLPGAAHLLGPRERLDAWEARHAKR